MPDLDSSIWMGKALSKARVIKVDEDAGGVLVAEQELTGTLLGKEVPTEDGPLLFLPFDQIRIAIARFE